MPVTLLDTPLLEVVARLCFRAGLTEDQFDVTGIGYPPKYVRAMATSQVGSVREILEQLAIAYQFDCRLSDKLYFVYRGESPVAEIAYEELGATMGDGSDVEPFALKRASDLEIPAQIAVTYPNVDRDYLPDTQYSDRLTSAVEESVTSMQLLCAHTTSEAKAIADAVLMDRVASVATVPIALLGSYTRLEPTDSVMVTDKDGSTFRVRLIKRTDNYPLLEFDGVLDATDALISEGVTADDYVPSNEVIPPPATVMALLGIPLLRDADDVPGFYVAAKGADAPWPGASILKSSDDTTFEAVAMVASSSVFGACTTTLGDWTGPHIFDEMNTLTVNVGAGELAGTTRDALLNDASINAAAVGVDGRYELIQFREADLQSPGVYILSGLLRGQAGTEWAMTGHEADESFTMLSKTALRSITTPNNELGVSKYFRGVTLGQPQSTATSQSFTDNGVRLKPYSPDDFRVIRDGSDNAALTWQRRTRYTVRMIGTLGISVPLGEQSEAYEIDVYADDTYATVVRTIAADAPAAAYTAADQTADGLTPGDPLFVKIYQLSAAVGRGYPLEASA